MYRRGFRQSVRKPVVPRIALTDGIGGDQAERAAVSQQLECTTKEMRHKIGIAMRASCSVCSQGRYSGLMPPMIVFLPANGGFPTMRRNPDCPARKPRGTRSANERARAVFARAKRGRRSLELIPFSADDPEIKLSTSARAFSRAFGLVGGEEGRDHRVAYDARGLRLRLPSKRAVYRAS